MVKNVTLTGFEPITSAIPAQCSVNWEFNPTGSLINLWQRSVPMDGEDRKVNIIQCKTAWLAQLLERQSVVREVEGSTEPTLGVLK